MKDFKTSEQDTNKFRVHRKGDQVVVHLERAGFGKMYYFSEEEASKLATAIERFSRDIRAYEFSHSILTEVSSDDG